MTDQTDASRPLHRMRVTASVVDLLVVTMLVSPALALVRSSPAPVRLGTVMLVCGLPTFLVEGLAGRSLGKMALGLSHAAPGDPRPSELRFALRFAVKWLVPVTFVALGFGPLAIAWWVLDYVPALQGERRALHDLAAGTRVLALV